MQKRKQTTPFLTRVVTIAAMALFLFACNNEAKPAEETKVDTPAVQTPPVVTDSIPKTVDTPSVRPGGGNN